MALKDLTMPLLFMSFILSARNANSNWLQSTRFLIPQKIENSALKIHLKEQRKLAQSEKFSDCVRDICGAQANSLSSDMNAMKAYRDSSDVENLTKKIIESSIKDNKNKLQFFKEALALDVQFSDENLLRLASPLYAFRFIDKVQVDRKSDKPLINKEVSRKALNGLLTIEEQDYVFEIVDHIYAINFDSISTHLWPGMASFYRGKETSRTIKSAQAEILKSYKRIDALLGQLEPASDYKNLKSMVTQAFRQSQKKGYESRQFFKNLNQIYVLFKFLEKVWVKNSSKEKPVFSEFSSKKVFGTQGVARSVDLMETWFQGDGLSSQISALNSTCQGAYKSNETFSPDRSEVLKFKERTASIKKDFEKGAAKIFEAGQLNSKELMAKWEIVGPLSKQHMREVMLNTLQEEIADNDNIEPKHYSNEEKLIFSLLTSPITEKDSIFSNEIEMCDDLKIDPFPDASLFSDNRALMGPVAYKYLTDLKFVVFHELGHLLGDALMNSKVQEVKEKVSVLTECLLSHHQEINGDKSRIPAQYFVEDLADFIGSQVAVKPENFGCYLLEGYPSFQKSLVNDSIADSHASYLFRTIAVYNTKYGKLPLSCNVPLKENGQSIPFKNCQFK